MIVNVPLNQEGGINYIFTSEKSRYSLPSTVNEIYSVFIDNRIYLFNGKLEIPITSTKESGGSSSRVRWEIYETPDLDGYNYYLTNNNNYLIVYYKSRTVGEDYSGTVTLVQSESGKQLKIDIVQPTAKSYVIVYATLSGFDQTMKAFGLDKDSEYVTLWFGLINCYLTDYPDIKLNISVSGTVSDLYNLALSSTPSGVVTDVSFGHIVELPNEISDEYFDVTGIENGNFRWNISGAGRDYGYNLATDEWMGSVDGYVIYPAFNQQGVYRNRDDNYILDVFASYAG